MSDHRTVDAPVRGGTLRAGIWTPEQDAAQAPTVLAIHGITASHLAWQQLADALPGHRVIAPDLRGRGRSNTLPGPWGMVSHADDLAALLATVGVEEPVVVVGHSMGAFVAVVLAHRHPELVSRLVLVDGGLPLPLPPGMDPEQAIQAVLGPAAERLSREFPSERAYLDFWRAHPAFADHWDAALERYLSYDLVGQAPHLRPATAVEAMVADSREVQGGASVAAALAALQHPTVFLRAERGLLDQPEGLYPAAAVAERAADLPRFEVREVPGSNHYTIIMAEPGLDAVASAARTS
ncbi:alpha/beta hydrolase [Enemella dayhoffiae]|uniref:Alpha/beta hydrolase n=1 Tax=Enemella dayhoffiae TaxID=2016507 RepID=A0A255GRM5_9ACTN|nr:alpha/beta fold hydrolase [Enemella dayhoffiae]OYO18062.1 alpha/beta hydrolase [Enemella dayhoffiae]